MKLFVTGAASTGEDWVLTLDGIEVARHSAVTGQALGDIADALYADLGTLFSTDPDYDDYAAVHVAGSSAITASRSASPTHSMAVNAG